MASSPRPSSCTCTDTPAWNRGSESEAIGKGICCSLRLPFRCRSGTRRRWTVRAFGYWEIPFANYGSSAQEVKANEKGVSFIRYSTKDIGTNSVSGNAHADIIGAEGSIPFTCKAEIPAATDSNEASSTVTIALKAKNTSQMKRLHFRPQLCRRYRLPVTWGQMKPLLSL